MVTRVGVFASVTLLVLTGIGAFAVACGDSSPAEVVTYTPPPGDGGVTVLPDGAVIQGDGAPLGPGTLSATVIGRSEPFPVANRQVKVRDSKGKVSDATTDANGAFAVPNVAPPYDLWIAASGADPNDEDSVYLGVSSMTIKVHGDVTQTPAPQKHAGTASLDWTTPSCGGGSCRMRIVVRTSDGSVVLGSHPGISPGTGPNHATGYFPPLKMALTWYGAATTQADIGFLLSSQDFTTHFYAHSSVSVAEGQVAPVPLGTIPPVATVGVGTLTATSTAPGTYQAANGTVYLQLPAPGGAFEYITGNLTPLSFGVPNIAGAMLAFHGLQSAPPSTSSVLIGGDKINLPLVAGAQTIELGDPNPLTAPPENGPLSVQTGSIEMRAAPDPRLRIVTLAPATKPRCRIHSGDPKIDLSRLVGLAPQLIPSSAEIIAEEQTRALDAYVVDVTAKATTRFASTSYAISLKP
jgi:hypothetical protein